MKNRSTLDSAPSASLAAVGGADSRSNRGFGAGFGAGAALGLGLLLTACQGLPPGKDGVTAVQFRDVVVPNGMSIITDGHKSHSVEAGSYRLGRYIYTGRVRAEEAASYVRQRMPLHNWTLVEDAKPSDTETRLRYERGYYSAEYTFTRKGGHTTMAVDYKTEYQER